MIIESPVGYALGDEFFPKAAGWTRVMVEKVARAYRKSYDSGYRLGREEPTI